MSISATGLLLAGLLAFMWGFIGIVGIVVLRWRIELERRSQLVPVDEDGDPE